MTTDFTEYVVLAQMRGDDADACEWTVYDGADAQAKAERYAHRLAARGWRAVTVRACGPIVYRNRAERNA